MLVTDHVDLSTKARDFLHTSIRRDRHRRRRTTILSVLLILALTAAGVAVSWQREAQEQQRIATASQLVAQADGARDTDLRTALQLGIAAERIHPDSETHTSLVNTLTNALDTYPVSGHTGPVTSLAFSPDRRTLATGSDDRSVILWDVSDPTRPHRLGQPLTGYTDHVSSVVFSPDGTTLATSSIDNTVILWDVSDPTQPRRLGLPRHNGAVSVAFSPDGGTLATASHDKTAILRDLTKSVRSPNPSD